MCLCKCIDLKARRVREEGGKLNKGFNKSMLRILDFIFLNVIESH